MRFDTSGELYVTEELHAADGNELYATKTEPACVMHGPVLRQHQDSNEMIQTIETACLAGNNNPDYQLVSLLGCNLQSG